MVLITSFIYCGETKEHEKSNQPEIVNPIQVIRTKYMPTYFTFSIVCVIYDMNLTQNNKVSLSFKKPDGEVIVDTGEAIINKRANDEDLLQINVEFRNVALESTGVYCTEVKLNNKLLGSYPIPVVKDVK